MPETVPVVIRYRENDVKQLLERKTQVNVLAKHNGWTRLRMNTSEDGYFAILDLPAGQQHFRFEIDGNIVVDTTQPTMREGEESISNVIVVNPDLRETKEEEDYINGHEAWGQVETQFDETRKYPPSVVQRICVGGVFRGV